MTDQPLDEGEGIDLDSGLEVTRGSDGGVYYYDPDQYIVRDGASSVIVTDEDIKTLAELAGYEVLD